MRPLDRGGFLGVVLALGLTVAAAIALWTSNSAARAAQGLHVVGNRLEDANGGTVVLQGVNRSGTEYACIQGWGIFDGPSNAASVRAMASWHVNFVRVPLNEDCWLGINGVKPSLGGARYREAVLAYVKLLWRFHIYAELSLIWAAPGRNQATYQTGAPDEDHAPAVWRSMASTFKDDPNVILAPWGETDVDAGCFLHGGICEATFGPHNRPYWVAGMQQAVDVMRDAGYLGVISIPGVDYANDLSRWLAFEPKDPDHQLIAEAHVYGGNSCSSVACLNRTMARVARRVPLIFGEVGDTYDDSSCGYGNVATFLRWAEAHRVGYAAWTWDTWHNCESLIASYSGAPAGSYGAWVKRFYSGVAARERRG
jgi:endoglucanase